MLRWIALLLGVSASGTFATAGEQDKTSFRIVALGDSLVAGHGVSESEAFPAVLQELLRRDPTLTLNLPRLKNLVVINAGIDGSTSASAVSRLKWLLKTPIDLLILELGANDGLRGIKPTETTKNLGEAIEVAQKAQVAIVLVGLRIPPNYGQAYTKEFANIFPALAKKYNIPLIPFLLEGVAGERLLNQADGIHPNAAGHKILAATVFRTVLPIIQKAPKP